jgi:hypothetical protein
MYKAPRVNRNKSAARHFIFTYKAAVSGKRFVGKNEMPRR